MKQKIVIIDYGAGNLYSLHNAFKFIGYSSDITNEIKNINRADVLLLPGVGSFGSAIKKIHSMIPLIILEDEILNNNKPFLGICVGMQVLVEFGFEHGKNIGLGWIEGNVELLEVIDEPLPHIGWNDIILKKDTHLFNGLNEINDFYFVHSYSVKTKESYILAETFYENNVLKKTLK